MPDVTSPEYLGSLSAIGAWRAILRNPYREGTNQHYRWQVARDAQLGKLHSKFGTNAGDHDGTIARKMRAHFYDTDSEDAA